MEDQNSQCHQVNVWVEKRGNPLSQMYANIIGQIVNILVFAGHMVSIVSTQFCHYTTKIAIDNT